MLSQALASLETLARHFPATFDKRTEWRNLSMEHAPAKLAPLRDSRMSYSWGFNPGTTLVDLDEYLVDLSGIKAELPHLIDSTGQLHVACCQFSYRRLHTAAMLR